MQPVQEWCKHSLCRSGVNAACPGVVQMQPVQEWCKCSLSRNGVNAACPGVVQTQPVQEWCKRSLSRSGVNAACPGVVETQPVQEWCKRSLLSLWLGISQNASSGGLWGHWLGSLCGRADRITNYATHPSLFFVLYMQLCMSLLVGNQRRLSAAGAFFPLNTSFITQSVMTSCTRSLSRIPAEI